VTTLYRLYDNAGALLYVGIANHWPARMNQHAREKAWWENVADVKLERYDTREDAERAEAKAIKAEHPMYNVVHAIRGTDATRQPPPPALQRRCPTAFDHTDIALRYWDQFNALCDAISDLLNAISRSDDEEMTWQELTTFLSDRAKVACFGDWSCGKCDDRSDHFSWPLIAQKWDQRGGSNIGYICRHCHRQYVVAGWMY
jgi:predicted GIY-YIG superfamily endonuclease